MHYVAVATRRCNSQIETLVRTLIRQPVIAQRRVKLSPDTRRQQTPQRARCTSAYLCVCIYGECCRFGIRTAVAAAPIATLCIVQCHGGACPLSLSMGRPVCTHCRHTRNSAYFSRSQVRHQLHTADYYTHRRTMGSCCREHHAKKNYARNTDWHALCTHAQRHAFCCRFLMGNGEMAMYNDNVHGGGGGKRHAFCYSRQIYSGTQAARARRVTVIGRHTDSSRLAWQAFPNGNEALLCVR